VSNPMVTVVIVNWNGEALLPDCLDALAKQDMPRGSWQVWVVDNGSTDGSLALLAERYPEVKVLPLPENLAFAGGNNVAMRTAGTPYTALLNNDAHAEPDWLRRLVAPMQAPDGERVAATTSKVVFEPRFLRLELGTPGFRPPGDPRELGALVRTVEVVLGGEATDVTERVLWEKVAYGPEDVGGVSFRWTRPSGMLLVPIGQHPATPADLSIRLVARAERAKSLTLRWTDGEATTQLADTEGVRELSIPAGTRLHDVINNAGSILLAPGYGADRGYQETDEGQYDEPAEVFLFSGTAMCFRTAALREQGVFDDHFFMYYEDTDLSWRFRAAGWEIRYVPDAVVRHIHSASSVEWSPFFTFHVERNRLLTLAKNAPARLAAEQALRFPLTTLSMLRRTVLEAVREQRRPALRPTLLRVHVFASYLRLLPTTLMARRRLERTRKVGQRELLDRWLTTTRT